MINLIPMLVFMELNGYTPGFDRIANEGLLFNHAYTTNAKCSPSRSTILTGRDVAF